MKRKVPLLLSVFGCALGGLAAGDAAAQAKFNLRWGHYLADSPFVQLEKDFAAEIEKRTNGQVKITITFAQGLGKTTELLTLTAKGAIDMTATAPGYNPDQLHYWRAFQLPLTFETSKQAMHVLGVVVKEFPVYRQEMNRAGVEWLFQQPLGEYYLSGSSPECNSMASLKGKKIRSFGADIPKAFTAIGAVPVTVAPTEIYEALQRGTLDYSFINAGNMQAFKLVEVAKQHCGPVMAITGHNITISSRTWKRLPKDIQQVFREQAAKTAQDYLAWVGDFEAKAAAGMKAQGANFKPFLAAELKKWRSSAPDFLAQWEKDTAEATKDAATPKKVAARWRQLLSK
jgi:TRAP-type C4-dicarboxylate transport system substrate-binding protein